MGGRGGYKKTVIVVEVLSDARWEWDTLSDVAYAISEGDCSGVAQERSVKFISERQAARELEKQGSDPEFLLGEGWERRVRKSSKARR